jgi:hypothetical protein
MRAASGIKWVIAVFLVVAVGGLFAGSAPGAGYGDSWVNAAGGACHTFEVEALNRSLADPSPAKRKFTIKR